MVTIAEKTNDLLKGYKKNGFSPNEYTYIIKPCSSLYNLLIKLQRCKFRDLNKDKLYNYMMKHPQIKLSATPNRHYAYMTSFI